MRLSFYRGTWVRIPSFPLTGHRRSFCLCLFLSVVMGNIQKDYGSMGKRWYARLKNWAFCYMITSKTKIITIVERKGW